MLGDKGAGMHIQNMKWPVVLMTAMLAWALALPTYADTAAAPTALSLQDCLLIAQHNQSQILSGQNDVIASKADVVIAKGAYFPQVSAQENQNVFHSTTTTGVLLPNGPSIGVTQNFYDGGLREATLAAKKATVVQSVHTLTRTQQTVAYQVTQNYFALLLAKKLAEVQDANVVSLQQQLDIIKVRVQVGDAAESDSLPVEASLANAQVAQLTAKNAARTDAITLQQAMGIRANDGFDIKDVPNPTPLAMKSLDEYRKLAMANRPDLIAAQAAIKAAKAQVTSAKISMYPRPYVTGNITQPFITGEGNISDISGGIAYNIFDAGGLRATYKQATANQSTQQINAEQIAKNLEVDVQNALINLTNAQESMAAGAVGLTASLKSRDVQEARYKEDLATTLDLLNAQVSVVTAQSNVVEARYAYYTSRAQLDYALGKQGGSNGK
jgi:outer membrane protein TolC